MDRYSDFTKHLALFLAVVYASAGGHTFCAPCYSAYSKQHTEHYCVHLLGTTEIHLSNGCCSDDQGNRRHLCSHSDLPAIVIQRSIAESTKLSEISSENLVFIVSVERPQSLPGSCDTLTFCSSAPSLRLHLLHGVLLI